MTTYLVTGAAGFIGFHVSRHLLERGDEVIGVDNLNDYYDPNLKKARLDLLMQQKAFSFHKIDIADRHQLEAFFRNEHFSKVIHLAAQPGVRYSLINPYSYVDSNLSGFINILEGSRHKSIEHLVYSSSSSVYGANTKLPYSVQDSVDHPVSLYAATKKANELMAHTYSHLFALPTTGLRFFTVYGPWGRPDMAYFIFTRAILEGRPIDVFNHGKLQRDFTYIDDIVDGVVRVADRVAQPDSSWSRDNPKSSSSDAPYRIYNIGNNRPANVMDFIDILEKALGKKAEKNFLPMQLGDVLATHADIEDLSTDVGFRPRTSLEQGLTEFVKWYRSYFHVCESCV